MQRNFFINDTFILCLILLNAITIFVSGFELSKPISHFLIISDNIITFLFVLELVLKIKEYGLIFFKSNWNKFDFIIIISSIPALIAFLFNLALHDFSFLLVFRVLRVFKTFRFLKFIPNIEGIIKGLRKALKASIFVFIGFIIYIFIIGILSFYLFKECSNELYGDPIKSLYSTFKIFTVEGWYDIPEVVTLELSPTASFFTYIFYIFVVLSGGILGLSLVNSIFVDAMVSDNNDELEKKIDAIDLKITDIITKLNNNEIRENT